MGFGRAVNSFATVSHDSCVTVSVGVGGVLTVSMRFHNGFATVSLGFGGLLLVSSRIHYGFVTVSVGYGMAVSSFVMGVQLFRWVSGGC